MSILGADRQHGLWPLLLLLLAAALAPTACVLWFMLEAVRNERLAVRQKLGTVYRSQLQAARDRLTAKAEEGRSRLEEHILGENPADTFVRLVVTDEFANSVIVYDADRGLLYPVRLRDAPRKEELDLPDRRGAWQLEHERNAPAEAAAVYQELAETLRAELAAEMYLAQARCLAKAGETAQALSVLTDTLGQKRFREASDEWGRSIQASALLYALEIMDDADAARRHDTAQRLARLLTSYDEPLMPSPQRRFLMARLRERYPPSEAFPTQAAEELAADWLEASGAPGASHLEPSPLRGVWQMTRTDKTIVCLIREAEIVAAARHFIDQAITVDGVNVQLRPSSPGASEAFLTLPMGEVLPGWELALTLVGSDPFSDAAGRQVTAYLWTGILVIAVIVIAALAVGRFVSRQMRLARLKNDLIATVSHEPKTPLASMRVLVDTLLEGNVENERQSGEYLQLIAKENIRLSRLIDNFLAFSRMERRRQKAFEFAEVKPAEIIAEAADAVRERFETAGCKFEVEAEENLPTITGDRGALVTLLLNLLDNAFKYSKDDRRIILRAYVAGEAICFAVQDNGIGLSRRAAKRIFGRFYQVDQSLSREVGGCGLGLSIVQFIVQAHGGSASVKSEPGKGSTFSVKLPMASRPTG